MWPQRGESPDQAEAFIEGQRVRSAVEGASGSEYGPVSEQDSADHTGRTKAPTPRIARPGHPSPPGGHASPDAFEAANALLRAGQVLVTIGDDVSIATKLIRFDDGSAVLTSDWRTPAASGYEATRVDLRSLEHDELATRLKIVFAGVEELMAAPSRQRPNL